MERKIEVCGMQLDNLTADEALRTVKGYFGKGRIYVVMYIYAELLKQLVQEEDFRQTVLDTTDLTVIGEKAVADVLEEPCELTDEEMAGQAVANRILQYCTKHQKTVFWLGESEEFYEIFRAYADKEFTQLRVVGAFAVGDEKSIEIEDEVVNEINRVSPDVIVSKLPGGYQEQFIARQKSKLNAQVWLGLSSKTMLTSEPLPTSSKIKAMIDKTILRRVVNANKE